MSEEKLTVVLSRGKNSLGLFVTVAESDGFHSPHFYAESMYAGTHEEAEAQIRRYLHPDVEIEYDENDGFGD